MSTLVLTSTTQSHGRKTQNTFTHITHLPSTPNVRGNLKNMSLLQPRKIASDINGFIFKD